MILVLGLVSALLLLKVTWNLSLPYVLTLRALRSPASPSRNISLMAMVIVELVLLGAAFILSFLSEPLPWKVSPLTLLLVGGALIIGSYLHLYVFGIVARWVAPGWSSDRRPGPLVADDRDRARRGSKR